MSIVKDLAGLQFGRLTVTGYVGRNEGLANRNHYWAVTCECGEKRTVNGSSLRCGDTKSCGCLKIEKAREAGDRTRTHGLSGTSVHNIWDSMIQRCNNPNRKDYASYGAKGIEVCKEWLKFDNFFRDMGPRPSRLTLDRIDNTKGYSPENCRWASTTQQGRNQSSNRNITFRGETMCMSAWAEKLGISYAALSARFHRGWSDEKALTSPIDKRFVRAKECDCNAGNTCNQGRSCPLRTRKLFWDRQQESIQRLASRTDDGDEVLSAGLQKDVADSEGAL